MMVNLPSAPKEYEGIFPPLLPLNVYHIETQHRENERQVNSNILKIIEAKIYPLNKDKIKHIRLKKQAIEDSAHKEMPSTESICQTVRKKAPQASGRHRKRLSADRVALAESAPNLVSGQFEDKIREKLRSVQKQCDVKATKLRKKRSSKHLGSAEERLSQKELVQFEHLQSKVESYLATQRKNLKKRHDQHNEENSANHNLIAEIIEPGVPVIELPQIQKLQKKKKKSSRHDPLKMLLSTVQRSGNLTQCLDQTRKGYAQRVIATEAEKRYPNKQQASNSQTIQFGSLLRNCAQTQSCEDRPLHKVNSLSVYKNQYTKNLFKNRLQKEMASDIVKEMLDDRKNQMKIKLNRKKIVKIR